MGCSDDAKEAVHNVRAEPDLQGTFTDACDTSKSAGQRIEYKFEGNDFQRSQIFYKESECTTETGRLIYAGEFVAGKQNTQDPRRGGTLDLSVQEVKMKVGTPEMARALNNITYCGNRDYAPGKEVTLKAGVLCDTQATPGNLYTIYRVENDRLYFGDKNVVAATSEPSQRSQGIIYESVYQRGSATGEEAQSKTEEVKSDIDKTAAEAKDDIQKTNEQANTDVKQVHDEVSADVKKTYDEASANVKKTNEQANADVKPVHDEASSDVKKTYDEASSDVKKTADQAGTDIKQAGDRVENKVEEIKDKN